MGLTQVELNCMLAGKSPIAQFALVCDPVGLVLRGWGGGVHKGTGEGLCEGVGLGRQQFFREAFGVVRDLASKLFAREFGQVPQPEAQVRFEMADVRGWRADLRGTVAAKEHGVSRVQVLQELGAAGPPELVLDIG